MIELCWAVASAVMMAVPDADRQPPGHAGRRTESSGVPGVSTPTVREATPRINYFVLLAMCYSASVGEEDTMRSPPLWSAR